MKKWMTWVGAAILLATQTVNSETLTNDTVRTLAGAGLGDDAIIAKIRNSASAFDMSTDNLVQLKKDGITNPVIAAMIEASSKSRISSNAAGTSDSPDPAAPHASGIYLLADWQTPAKMIRMDATISNQTKTSDFLGYALTAGLASVKIKTVLPNSSARVKASGMRPVFYFYFDQANSLSNSGNTGFWSAGASPVTSPNEFSLVKFDVRKANREAIVAKMSVAGAKSGVMDSARISYSYTDIAPGVFKVTPDQDLKPGEYGFIYSSSSGGGIGLYAAGATSSKIFDFTIQ